MDSKEIHRAMRLRLPVMYDGRRFERVSEYISWYNDKGQHQLSAVLIDKNYSMRVLADRVELAE